MAGQGTRKHLRIFGYALAREMFVTRVVTQVRKSKLAQKSANTGWR